MRIPEQCFAPRESAVNPESLRSGTDFVSGYVQFKAQECQSFFYAVVVVLKPFEDIITFDVGLVADEADLPGSSTTCQDLAMRKELGLNGFTYRISQYRETGCSKDGIYFLLTKEQGRGCGDHK